MFNKIALQSTIKHKEYPFIDKLFNTFKLLTIKMEYHQRIGAVNGYGHMNVVAIKITMPTKVCRNCGILHNTSLINAWNRWGLALKPLDTKLCIRHKWVGCDFDLFYYEHHDYVSCMNEIERKAELFFKSQFIDDLDLPELDYYAKPFNWSRSDYSEIQ